MQVKTAARKRLRATLAISALALIVAGAWIARVGLTPRVLAPLLELRYPDVRSISASELESSMRSSSPPTLLDVRSDQEIAVSALRGARARDPDTDATIDGPIVVYCSVGWRSAIAARQLARGGARDVRNLEGGIFEWANEGRPVLRGTRVVRDVHPFDRLWAVFLDDELETYAP